MGGVCWFGFFTATVFSLSLKMPVLPWFPRSSFIFLSGDAMGSVLLLQQRCPKQVLSSIPCAVTLKDHAAVNDCAEETKGWLLTRSERKPAISPGAPACSQSPSQACQIREMLFTLRLEELGVIAQKLNSNYVLLENCVLLLHWPGPHLAGLIILRPRYAKLITTLVNVCPFRIGRAPPYSPC